MIELTDQQVQALEHSDSTPPRVVNPRSKETFVLLRVDEYQRLERASIKCSGVSTVLEVAAALAW
jgi:hypothetical protein